MSSKRDSMVNEIMSSLIFYMSNRLSEAEEHLLYKYFIPFIEEKVASDNYDPMKDVVDAMVDWSKTFAYFKDDVYMHLREELESSKFDVYFE